MADDSHLRHVEKEVMIPKIMREKAKENCKQYVKGKLEIYMDRLNSNFDFPSTTQLLKIVVEEERYPWCGPVGRKTMP